MPKMPESEKKEEESSESREEKKEQVFRYFLGIFKFLMKGFTFYLSFRFVVDF